MKRLALCLTLATAGMAAATPATAQLLGGVGGGVGGSVGGSVGSTVQGTLGAPGGVGATVRDATRINSQGTANASTRGLSRASTRSSLNAAGRTDLGAVVKGTAIKGSGGANVGTVSNVVVNRSGAVVGVKVDLAGGGTATIPASTLSVDGSAVTTTWVHGH
jgi:hypothetical protein